MIVAMEQNVRRDNIRRSPCQACPDIIVISGVTLYLELYPRICIGPWTPGARAVGWSDIDGVVQFAGPSRPSPIFSTSDMQGSFCNDRVKLSIRSLNYHS